VADTTAPLADPETSAVADEAAIPSVEGVHLDAEADAAASVAEPETTGAAADEAAHEGEVEAEPAAKEEEVLAGETEAVYPEESAEEEVKDTTEVPAVLAKEKVIHPTVSRRFGLYLVGNKYNPSNFWSVTPFGLGRFELQCVF